MISEETGEYMLTGSEVQKIHRRYKQLSQNRMDHVMRVRKERQAERKAARNEQAQPTGRPMINAKSQKMIANKVPTGISYQDYLLQRGKDYELRRMERQHQKDVMEAQNEECTFKPAIHGSSAKQAEQDPNVPYMSPFGPVANKWDELYLESKRKPKKDDRTKDDIEFEKNRHELRFRPEVHEVNVTGSKRPILSARPSKRPTGLRQRMQEKLEYLNAGINGTLADNPEIGTEQHGSDDEEM